ncbi:type II secretion system protein [Paludisphaera mucosa]|uniref:Type II secretion system protein n=1 Tax=Paludisphaera mucosa TaxID=3030827 RepID=A0ABT6F7F5_9BACT|nr:type II secretion system protein [Paludisphaera mucosa]MDG3003325.1 type II secretion system protein [Paludisphaera mucosa]
MTLDGRKNDLRRRIRPEAWSLRRGAFTLIELMVVMVIIGILLVFILNASWSAVRSAREKATQSLISKLDVALTDRLDAILQSRPPDPTQVQGLIARCYDTLTPATDPRMSERAYVLAQIEFFAREVPDVFYLQDVATYGYPLNFAANPYPISSGNPNGGTDTPPTDAEFVLPLGDGWPLGASGSNYFNPGEGIYGASYHMAAGLYKNLGYQPTGYDGIDNDGDGRIDNWAEGVNQAPAFTTADATVLETVQSRLGLHKHKTARAEVLYALLVESQGPFGSIFEREDFTDQEVKDTDGDGLPEFVDSWGEPLQFYRWPLLFSSGLQRGQKFQSVNEDVAYAAPYAGMIEQRELDGFDPNQQLMSPAWWSSAYNDPTSVTSLFPTLFAAKSRNRSAGVAFFENYFHLLHEPLLYGSSTGVGLFWDRGAPSGDFAARRALTSKFLIVSAGPDKELGLLMFDDASLRAAISDAASTSAYSAAYPLIALESQAAPLSLLDLTRLVTDQASIGGLITKDDTAPEDSYRIQARGQDDINSHNIPAGGIGGSAP